MLTVLRVVVIAWGILSAAYFVWMVVVYIRGPFE